MSLLALPTELLEKIVITTDPCTSSRQAIRLTCRTLCDVATPFVFEHFYIDFAKIETHKSHTIRFLKELSQGRRLARFIRSLYFLTSSVTYKPKFSGIWCAKIFSQRVGRLILAAVLQMQGLQEFHWIELGKAKMGSEIMDQIIHSLSDRPHLHFVSISAYGIDDDIPCAPFHGLTRLLISGHGSLDYVPAIIANSPNLSTLGVVTDRRDSPSPPHFPVLSLFSAFAEGTHSSVQEAVLEGDYFSLEPSTIPALIPHLRNLSEFCLPLGFIVPDEFWNALLDADVHLPYVRSHDIPLTNSFLHYLGAYHGLKMLHLCPSAPGNDQTDTRLFLRHIIPAHSSSLTSIVVQPKYAGSWCFDIPMLKALLLCTNLEHIAISIDMQRAQVKHNENVITKLLKNVQHWHSLRQLEIAAISTDPTARSPSTADEEKSLKEDICVRIVNCLMKFGCRDLTLQMLKLMVDTDFIYNLQPCLFESDSQIYIFLPPRLPGMRDGMEAIPILDKIEGEFIHFIYILPE